MDYARLVDVGVVQRTHGVNGEVQVGWADSVDPLELSLKSVFLRIEGIPIPFMVESHRGKGEGVTILKLDEVDSAESAMQFVGAEVLVEGDGEVEEDDQLYLDDLVGYTMVTQQGTLLGEITELQDFSGNLIFTVTNSSGKELLVPASTDFIVELNEDTKTLLVDLPQGLTGL